MAIISNKCYYDSSYDKLSPHRLVHLRTKLLYRFIRTRKIYFLLMTAFPKQEGGWRRSLAAQQFNIERTVKALLMDGMICRSYNEIDMLVELDGVIGYYSRKSLSKEFDGLLHKYGLCSDKIEQCNGWDWIL